MTTPTPVHTRLTPLSSEQEEVLVTVREFVRLPLDGLLVKVPRCADHPGRELRRRDTHPVLSAYASLSKTMFRASSMSISSIICLGCRMKDTVRDKTAGPLGDNDAQCVLRMARPAVRPNVLDSKEGSVKTLK